MPPLTESIAKSGPGSWIEIRTDRLQNNLSLIKKSAGNAHVMAVVKANAYGHGLLETAKVLAGQVDYLGVSSLYEALELKEHGIETPVFLFGHLFGNELQTAVKNGFTLSVSSYEEAREIAHLSLVAERRTKIHIKVDTGMGRLGIPEADALGTIEKIAELKGLMLEGLFTHFPTAESRDLFTETQVQKLAVLLECLESRAITFRFRHAANSAGSLRIKTPVLNMIRPGLLLYGIYPDANLKNFSGFAPVLSLKSRLIHVKKITPGESVGYGRTFVAKKKSTIGVIPIGYSHGYPFHLSNRAWALYKGRRVPIAGRVSMDYLAFDLGDEPAQVGDEVTLIGEDGADSLTAEQLAAWAGTIPYEIVTRLTSRLPRIYK